MTPVRRRLLYLVLVVVVVIGLGVGAVFSPFLAVDRVVVVGADGREVEVLDKADIKIGTPLLIGSISGATERVAELSWVADARLDKKLPGTARIIVKKRVPVAFVKGPDGAIGLVDASGIVIETAAAAPVGIPEIKTPGPVPAVGAVVDAPEAAKVAAALGPLAARVAYLVVVDKMVTLYLTTGPEVRFGGLDRLGEKVRATEATLGAIGTSGFNYLDVRVPSGPVTG